MLSRFSYFQFKSSCYDLKTLYVSLVVIKGEKPVVVTHKNRIKKSRHTDTKASKHTKRQLVKKQDLKQS